MPRERFVWLACASASLILWSVVYLACPRLRRAMRWSSVAALPFALSEMLFAGDYWSPPSLFDFARAVHLDLESFVFLFATGGLASVAYDVATGSTPNVSVVEAATRPARERQRLALATPALLFPAALVVSGRPIVAACVAMSAGAIARGVARADLATKTFVGGALFFGGYVAVLALLVGLEPSYVARVWNPRGGIPGTVRGLPVSELLYGGSFGCYWSGLYEHVHATLALPRG